MASASQPKQRPSIINFAAFNQLLELDDDDTHEYSKDMVTMYFAQAPTAFAGMDVALYAPILPAPLNYTHPIFCFFSPSFVFLGLSEIPLLLFSAVYRASKDLQGLSDLAHFLMGSSATLGIARVAFACQCMESVGKAGLLVPESSTPAAAEGDKTKTGKEDALDQVAALLAEGKREYAEAEIWLRKWYAEHGQHFDDPATKPAAQTPEATLHKDEPSSTQKVETSDTMAVAGTISPPPPNKESIAISTVPHTDL
ncbi:hypothetical protein R3P38DRAFT_1853063 [Favolaschia claudopus]|uniref:HPt domain-containing protein n=1 Tax=Favolaschia claudopus TaxID=2862362 RepID=A0AAW0DAH5_9AGAR